MSIELRLLDTYAAKHIKPIASFPPITPLLIKVMC